MHNDQIHLLITFTGHCTKCHRFNSAVVQDYGVLSMEQLETILDTHSYQAVPLQCKKCGTLYPAERRVYTDKIRNILIGEEKISYADMDTDEHRMLMEGHDARIQIYQEQEAEFWMIYTDFALSDWTRAVQELNKAEIADGLNAIDQDQPLRTDLHARKEAQKVPASSRSAFWKAANHTFVQDLLDIGALAWLPQDYAKQYGANRTRAAMMYFPIAEALEIKRTEHLGQLFKRERGDNDFWMRRVVQLTQAIQKQRVKYNELYLQADQQKHIIAQLQDRLGEAHQLHRQQSEVATHRSDSSRDPDDIRQIRELKSFITELKHEMKQLQAQIAPAEDSLPDVPLLTSALPEDRSLHKDDRFAHLKDKTVLILGGYSAKQVYNEYPCTILSHDGRKQDPDYQAYLKKADGVIVLTRFISHAAMWEAKEYVTLIDPKPACYRPETNLDLLLDYLNKAFSLEAPALSN